MNSGLMTGSLKYSTNDKSLEEIFPLGSMSRFYHISNHENFTPRNIHEILRANRALSIEICDIFVKKLEVGTL